MRLTKHKSTLRSYENARMMDCDFWVKAKKRTQQIAKQLTGIVDKEILDKINSWKFGHKLLDEGSISAQVKYAAGVLCNYIEGWD